MGNIAGIIAGLLSKGGSTVDLGQLYSTIQNAGQYQQQIINALPAEIQANLAKYAQSQNAAGTTLQGNITSLGNSYLGNVEGLYGPNSAAATAEKAANTKDIYSTVPGTQNAIRNALAASGGLQRGQAGTALASPYVTAASTAAKANAGVNAQQAQAGQSATQQALSTITSMDANTFQQLFGMSLQQAQTILTTGNQALQQQLAQLINQSTTQTNQLLGVGGIGATNGYNNSVLNNQMYNSILGNGVGLGLDTVSGMFGGAPGIFAGLSSGAIPGMDTSSPYYQMNSGLNSPLNQ